MRRWLITIAAVIVLGAIGAGVAYYLHVRHQARDIEGSSTIEFVTTEAAAPPPPEPGIEWQMYGHDPERLRVANGVSLAPPFNRMDVPRAEPRRVSAGARLRAPLLRHERGHRRCDQRQDRQSGRGISSRVAAGDVTGGARPVDLRDVPELVLRARRAAPINGELWRSGRLGQVPWKKTIGPSESSPAIVNGDVFVGDWNGTSTGSRPRPAGSGGSTPPARRSRAGSRSQATGSTSAPTRGSIR